MLFVFTLIIYDTKSLKKDLEYNEEIICVGVCRCVYVCDGRGIVCMWVCVGGVCVTLPPNNWIINEMYVWLCGCVCVLGGGGIAVLVHSSECYFLNPDTPKGLNGCRGRDHCLFFAVK